MHHHATLGRLVIILALSLAGCAPQGSPGPSAAASSGGPAATAGASPSVPPFASPVAIALPTCTDPYALPSHSALRFVNVRGQPGASLHHVVATSTGSFGFVVSIPDAGTGSVDDIGNLVGNARMAIGLVNADGSDLDPAHPRVVTEASGTFEDGKGRAARPLATTVTTDITVVQVPDFDGRINVRLHLAWTDGCFTYRGDASATAQVGLAATVATCPTAQEQAGVLAALLARTSIRIGSVSHLLTIENWSGKYVDMGASIDETMFQGTDFKSSPQAIRAGGEIVISEASSDLRIDQISAQFYRLDRVLADPTDSSIEVVFPSVGAVRADGSFGVPVPATRGSYVMEISVSWSSSCLFGYGREWVTVQTT